MQIQIADRILFVKPKKNFRHIGWATMETLDKTKTYKAIKAVNQPDWEAKGLIFIDDFLLNKDEYDVVTEESEATPTHEFCWWA